MPPMGDDVQNTDVMQEGWFVSLINSTAASARVLNVRKQTLENFCLSGFQLKAQQPPSLGGRIPLYTWPFNVLWGSGDKCEWQMQPHDWIPIPFVCVYVCPCWNSLTSWQLLSPYSAGSMTSSRTTTPATIRRRPSRRPRGARRSTTAGGCWGARWARSQHRAASLSAAHGRLHHPSIWHKCQLL